MTARWAWAEVDLDAIAHNVRSVIERVAPSGVWAVVKANAYGHGAVPVAAEAVAAGAHGLCVALAQEGVQLREGGLQCPILVLSDEPLDALDAVVEAQLIPTVYSLAAVEQLAAAVRRGRGRPYPVAVKVDTGMRRVGCRPEQLAELVAAVDSSGVLTLHSVFTHFAAADDPNDPTTAEQLQRFDESLATLGAPPPLVHAANSAGALAHHAARRSFVRLGIAAYGLDASDALPAAAFGLLPAMSLKARVSFVKRVDEGEAISYGLTHRFERATTVATLPLGYADGVPRRLSASGGEVLIGGRRHPIVGRVTMDQIMVDCGDHAVGIGDEAVLIGSQGAESISADDVARLTGTIGYEIVCAVSPRIERRYLRCGPVSE